MNRKQKKFNDYTDKDRLLEGGEGEAAAENPPADNEAAADNKSKAASEKGSAKPEEEKAEEKPAKKNNPDDDDPFAEPILEPCCCCECVCANEFTKESSCCGCFPIKCGVVTIGLITVFITAILFVWYFFLFLNEYIHWWYVLVCLFLLCPILVGSSFVISWFTMDTRTTRTMLYTSQILALVSVFLLACWNLIYFVFIYKKDKFFAGMGDIPSNVYTQQNKKNFLFTMLAETVIMLVMFGYFLCVTAAYSEDMHGPEDAAAPVDEKAASKPPSAQSKKSKQPSEKAEDKPAEDAPAAGDAAE
jgi:cation transport ATPase